MSSEIQYAQPRTPLDFSPEPRLKSPEPPKKKQFIRQVRNSVPVDKVTTTIWINGILPYLNFCQAELANVFGTCTKWRDFSKHPNCYKMICYQQGIVFDAKDPKASAKKYKTFLHCLGLANNFLPEIFNVPKSKEKCSEVLFFESSGDKMVTFEKSGVLSKWPSLAPPVHVVRSLGECDHGTVEGERLIVARKQEVELWNFHEGRDHTKPYMTTSFDEKIGAVTLLSFRHPFLAIANTNYLHVLDVRDQAKPIVGRIGTSEYRCLNFVGDSVSILTVDGSVRYFSLINGKAYSKYKIANAQNATSCHMFSNYLLLGFKNGSVDVYDCDMKGAQKKGTLTANKKPIVDISHCSFKVFAVLDIENTISIWDVADLKKPLKSFKQSLSDKVIPTFVRLNLLDQRLVTLGKGENNTLLVTSTFYSKENKGSQSSSS